MEVETVGQEDRAPRRARTPRPRARHSRPPPRPTRTGTAIRTRDDEFSCTWGEYAERVEALAAGLASLGVEPGDTVALMLANRPEFHFADSAVMHLGATPFSIYNTYTAEQIEHLLERRRQPRGDHRAGATSTRSSPPGRRSTRSSTSSSWTATPSPGRDLARRPGRARCTTGSTSRPRGRPWSPTTC